MRRSDESKVLRAAACGLLFRMVCTAGYLIVMSSFSWAGISDARYYFQLGDWKKAVEEYSAALGDKPETKDLNQIGEALYKMGRYGAAEQYLQRSLNQSNDLGSRIKLLLLKARQGGQDEALAALEGLSRDMPGDNRIYTALGILKSANVERDGLPYFFKAVELQPDDFDAWFNIGLIYEDEEQFVEATKAYKNAVRINPAHAQAWNNLGYSYKERHYYAYAVENYQMAIDLMPDNAGFYYNIGNAYSHQERIDAAFDAYKKAVELAPSFAKAHYNLARTWLRKDMVKEAIEEFRLYLKYGNNAIFRFVASRQAVEEEIEQLEAYLASNSSFRPVVRNIAK